MEKAAADHALGHCRAVDQTKFLTIGEVAERLYVSTRTVRRWIKSGDLSVHQFGRVVRISVSDLRSFLTAHRE
jgi:excisionase family DNA binding protein